MNTVDIVCKADGNGNPHDRYRMAEARWDDEAAEKMTLVIFGPLFSIGREVQATEFLSQTGYRIECDRCQRGMTLSTGVWRERIEEARDVGEIGVSQDLQ
jgi:hypothetical protein